MPYTAAMSLPTANATFPWERDGSPRERQGRNEYKPAEFRMDRADARTTLVRRHARACRQGQPRVTTHTTEADLAAEAASRGAIPIDWPGNLDRSPYRRAVRTPRGLRLPESTAVSAFPCEFRPLRAPRVRRRGQPGLTGNG